MGASQGSSPTRGSPSRKGLDDATDTQSNMTGMTRMSPTKTQLGGSMYGLGSGFPG
jgi:hypothetical protein